MKKERQAERWSLDIATGNVPDILDVSHGISTEQFIKKGLLADLYPLMEKDEEIKKEKFVPSVLRTLENDGKLYYMPVSFSI